MSYFKETLMSAAFLSAMIVSPALAQESSSVMLQGSSYVGSVGGNVVIKRSGEFSIAQSSRAIMDGDMVATLEGGTASVALANGCTVDLSSEQSVIINLSGESCESSLVMGDQEFYAQEIEGGSGIILALLAAAAVIAGIIIIADDDTPTSP